MVDHIRVDGDKVKVVTFNADGDFTVPVLDAGVAHVILAQIPIYQVLPKLRQSDARPFLASVLSHVTPYEGTGVATVWGAIRAELTDDQHEFLEEAFGEGEVDRAVADLIILKYLRDCHRAAFVRGSIADAARSVKSLASKAKRIAGDLATIAKDLEHETAADINWTAVEAQMVADGVADETDSLSAVIAELGAKRDAVLGVGRRSHAARRCFALEWLTLWRTVGFAVNDDMAENVIAAAVEAVELPSLKAKNGKDAIGKGQRDWVLPLIKDASA